MIRMSVGYIVRRGGLGLVVALGIHTLVGRPR